MDLNVGDYPIPCTTLSSSSSSGFREVAALMGLGRWEGGGPWGCLPAGDTGGLPVGAGPWGQAGRVPDCLQGSPHPSVLPMGFMLSSTPLHLSPFSAGWTCVLSTPRCSQGLGQTTPEPPSGVIQKQDLGCFHPPLCSPH